MATPISPKQRRKRREQRQNAALAAFPRQVRQAQRGALGTNRFGLPVHPRRQTNPVATARLAVRIAQRKSSDGEPMHNNTANQSAAGHVARSNWRNKRAAPAPAFNPTKPTGQAWRKAASSLRKRRRATRSFRRG